MSNELETLFSPEEQEVIQKCVDTGMLDSIPSALESAGFSNMTPDREKALDKYIASFRTVSDEGSEVLSELQQKELKEGYRIESPEEEKKWQEKLDKEMAEKKEKQMQRMGIEEMPVTDRTPDNASDFSLSKNEIMEQLKTRGIPFKPQQSKAELASLLEAA